MGFGDDFSPVLYQDRVPGNYTKFQVFQKIHKGLVAVGMQPIMGPEWTVAPIDLLDDDNLFGHLRNTLGVFAAYYDFPDSARTFTVDGVSYRPIIAMSLGNYQANSTTTPNVGLITLRLRKTGDPATLSAAVDTISMAGGAQSASYELWDNSLTDSVTNTYGGSSGFRWGNYHTKLFERDRYSSGSSQPTEYIQLRNVEVLLSKGGLLVQAGSGFRKNDAGDVLCLACLFMDGRIPGMRKTPTSDDELNASVPIIMTPLKADSDLYYGANSRPRGLILGCSYINPEGVLTPFIGRGQVELFPKENLVDRALLLNDPRVWDSPRTFGDAAYHVLSPAVGYAWRDRDNQSTILCSTVPDFHTTDPYPKHEELYYTPYFAFTDPVAPYGLFTDPNSGKQWFLFRGEASETMYGFEVEGLTSYDQTYTVTHTQNSETHLALTTGVMVADDGTPVDLFTLGADWSVDGPNDTLSRTFTNTEGAGVDIELDVSGDAAGTEYELIYDARFRGDAGTEYYNDTSNNRYIGTLAEIRCTHRDRGAAAAEYRDWSEGCVLCAGADTAESYYDWAEYRRHLTLNQDTGQLVFRIFTDYMALSGSKTIEYRNFRLRRVTHYS